MVTHTIKRKRTRITQRDIDKARQDLLVQDEKPVRTKPEKERPKWGKDSWFGLVYCDSYGHAWIDIFEPAYLGRTGEFIPYLKSKGIDGENVDMVINAFGEFQSEKKSQSYHLATKNGTGHISIPPAKSHRITLKKDPHFLASLDKLISKGYGIPTNQRKLKAKGYDIPYATLGRWVKERRDTI